MEKNRIDIIKIYMILDITDSYTYISKKDMRKYRKSDIENLKNGESVYKVICKENRNGKNIITTKIWTDTELDEIKEDYYYYE